MSKLTPVGGWARFEGFSCLFDNPQGEQSLAPFHGYPGVAVIDCDRRVSLYNALADWCSDRLPGSEFSPLPVNSYHVTVWDGISQATVGSLTAPWNRRFAEFIGGFPETFLDELPWGLPPNFDLQNGQITFEVLDLEIWERSAVLVAVLKPADRSSSNALDVLIQGREEAYAEWEVIGRPDPTKQYPYTPHISLGYFASKRVAHRMIESGELLKESLVTSNLPTISFESVDFYGFTNMATFFKRTTRTDSEAVRG